jgi:hypothetical protein
MHLQIIRTEALFMALAGGVVTYGTILVRHQSYLIYIVSVHNFSLGRNLFCSRLCFWLTSCFTLSFC